MIKRINFNKILKVFFFFIVFIFINFSIHSQEIIWEKNFKQDTISIIGDNIAIDKDSNLIVTSSSTGSQVGYRYYGIGKYNQNGDSLWYREYKKNKPYYLDKIIISEKNEYSFVGYYVLLWVADMMNNYAFFFFNTDNIGNVTYEGIDTNTKGISYPYELYSNICLNNKNQYLITTHINYHYDSLGLILFDSLGHVLWQKFICSSDNKDSFLIASSINQLSNNNYIISGTNLLKNEYGGKIFIIELDSNFKVISNKFVSKDLMERSINLKNSNDSYFTLSRYVIPLNDTIVSRNIIRKFNYLGEIVFETKIGLNKRDFILDFLCTEDGGAILYGSSRTDKDIYTKFYLVRIDSEGKIVWQKVWGNEKMDNYLKDAVLVENHCYITGRRDGMYLAKINCDYTNVSYDNVSNSELKVIPNPADKNIRIILPKYNFINSSLNIYDILGNEILVIDKIYNEVIDVNISNFPIGSYIIVFKNNDIIDTEKVFILR